jgi:hypothetical protein
MTACIEKEEIPGFPYFCDFLFILAQVQQLS